MIITKKLLIEKCACKDGLDFMEENNLYNMDSQDLALKLLELKEFDYFVWFTKNFKIEDRKEMRDRITGSYYAYRYCKNVKDTKEIRDKITDSYSAYLYCENIEDRKEIRDKITDSDDACFYCEYVKDRKDMRDKITDSDDAYLYCRYTSKKDKRLNELAEQFKKGGFCE